MKYYILTKSNVNLSQYVYSIMDEISKEDNPVILIDSRDKKKTDADRSAMDFSEMLGVSIEFIEFPEQHADAAIILYEDGKHEYHVMNGSER